MAETTKEAAKLLGVSPLSRAQNYKVQLMMGLQRLPRRLMNAILDTGARLNLICKSAIPQAYWEEVKKIKSKWL